MADGQGMLSSLNNLPVFQGVPDQERQRALLEAGLAMMQPYDQLSGSPLTQLTGGVSQGLQSLDTSRGERQAQAQLGVQNQLQQGMLNNDVTRTGILQQNADTDQAASEAQATNAAGTLEQAKTEWLEGGKSRTAQQALDYAKAKYYDRMPESGTGGSLSSADIMINKHIAKLNAMWDIDKAKPITEQRFASKSDPLLVDEAWGALTVREGVAGSEALGVISQNTTDAAATGRNLIAATDPNAVAGQQPRSPEDIQMAQNMATWTKEQWAAVAAGPDNPEINRLLLAFPGVRARARAMLAE